jgi:hypothetical protein
MKCLRAIAPLLLSAFAAFAAEERSASWAFKPATRPAVPQVANKNWPRTTIDRFVLNKLEASGLSPSAEADRRTLLRR